jgi:hypothetical protein
MYVEKIIILVCTNFKWPRFPRTSAQPAESVEGFREARLKLNPAKCQLLRKDVRYLGHTVSLEAITTDPEKLKAVREWPTPKNKHEIRSDSDSQCDR